MFKSRPRTRVKSYSSESVEDIPIYSEDLGKDGPSIVETQINERIDNIENNAGEDSTWWDSDSQNLFGSQQLVEVLSLCDDLLQSLPPNRDGENELEEQPSLSVYAHLGPEHLKKDIEECQNLVLDTANVQPETPPSDFRLSPMFSMFWHNTEFIVTTT
ncbi:hypothetical protein RJT34_24622 [Clitoria ternatea]|uniref:Uncharacterized protein n=1 Tax=Clitoria ternatea TaxID=43366 RepID=A0AAN9FND8_CLITE